MRPFDFLLLADENIHPEVVAHLRRQGKDVQTVLRQAIWANPKELGYGG